MPRESHHRDIVSLVETAPPKIDSDTLLKTACRALEVMEPWHSATQVYSFTLLFYELIAVYLAQAPLS